jgi:hypothetical protein
MRKFGGRRLARALLADRECLRPGPTLEAMDEPTHAHESLFWDQVADCLLAARSMEGRALTAEDIEALLREMWEGQEPP